MFKRNDEHRQQEVFDAANLLPEKLRQKLEASWASVFYHEVFCRIDEEIFADLYSEKASRPNVPVNVLVALEILKSGFGWSDRELHEQLCFNLLAWEKRCLSCARSTTFEDGCGNTRKRRGRTCLGRFLRR